MTIFHGMYSAHFDVCVCVTFTDQQIDGGNVETMADFILLGSKITMDGDCCVKLQDTCSLEEKL